MEQFVFDMSVTINARDLDHAIGLAHMLAAVVEDPDVTGEIVESAVLGDHYERVINEYGDTEPAVE
jgi:hypothetical protein